MRFKLGDRVRSTRLPPDIHESNHEVGTVGTVAEIADYDGQRACLVEFVDDRDWYCYENDLEFDPPPCTIEEALTGINEILTTETLHEE